VSAHGTLAAVEKHRSHGMLLARERINLLVDAQTPFLTSVVKLPSLDFCSFYNINKFKATNFA